MGIVHDDSQSCFLTPEKAYCSYTIPGNDAFFEVPVGRLDADLFLTPASRKHLRTKVTPDFHLTYSKNGGNLGLESK